MKYEIVDVSKFATDEVEPLGTKSKYWFSDSKGVSYLFKSIETYDSNNQLVSRGGEDWAEKISCEIAKALSIPCADYELANNGKTRGVITKNFIMAPNAYLVTGNEILKNFSPPTPVTGQKNNERQNVMHIHTLLRRLVRHKPPGFNSLAGIKSAADFFTGYLLLDALISNQDRHSENWGLVVTGHGRFHLAPTFDHAASLARNESEENKEKRLHSPDIGQQVSTYVKRAKSYFYLRNNRLKTLQAFEYFGVLNPSAALRWLEQLSGLTPEIMRAIIEPVPEEIMSNVSKKFALEMLLCNRSNMMTLGTFFEQNLDQAFRKNQIENYE